MDWYKIKDKVLDFMDFLLDAGLLESKNDVIDFVTHTEKYTEAYGFYIKEITGDSGITI